MILLILYSFSEPSTICWSLLGLVCSMSMLKEDLLA